MTSITPDKQALLYGLAAVTLWSTVATGFKLGLGVLTTEQLLLLGTVFSWIVFFVYVLSTRRFYIQGRDWGLAIGLGVINPWAYYLILFAAYDRLPAHIAQPINYTWAITLAVLSVPMLKQKLGGRAALGIALSYSGVVALVNLSAPAEQGLSYTGIGLALLSTVLWAVYWLLNTRSTSDPASMMLVGFTAALPLVALSCWWSGLPAINPTTLFYGAWVGLVEMGVTFLLWQQALKRTSRAAAIGQLIFLSPFLSLVMIHFFLGEEITSGAIGSLAVIVIGIAITQRAVRPPA